MALLMVQSERLEDLAPVDHRSLERRLAEWHQSVMPPDKRTEEVYAGTGLSREAYKEWDFPTEWRLWEAGTRRVVGVDEPYPGGAADSARLNGTPARDVVEWSADLALMGILPDSFLDFLSDIGHKAADRRSVRDALQALLRRHLRDAYFSYMRLLRTCGRGRMDRAERGRRRGIVAGKRPLGLPVGARRPRVVGRRGGGPGVPSVFPDGGGPSGFGSGTLREAGWAPLVLMAPLLLRDEFGRCGREWREAPWSTGPLGASLMAVAAGIALAGVTGPRKVVWVNRPVLAPTNKPTVARG